MTNTKNSSTCRCECGEPVGAKANYRPGHHARHAGIVARAITENPKQVKTLLNTLPSAALQSKATRAVERLTAKPEAKEAVA
ncbi:hypothetical protein [Cryobacterium sp. BB307]|uniref:hypothetical protein n=1 Tax=Cryobacterium sp. BB307 TaxID=2716317 RepID=UPI001445D666|nr:hypothetical protein [Cryobacterium sp. BB307]